MKALQHLNKYLFKYRYQLLLGIIITVIGRIFSLVAPRLIGNSLTAVEQFLKKGEADADVLQKELLINILIIISTALGSGIFTFWMRQTIINVSRYIEFDLKNEIFWHYQQLSQKFFKVNRTGDLMSRISEDVSKARMYVGPALMYSINTIALFFIVISYMLSIAPTLTLYTIIPLPVLSIAIYKLSRVINLRSTAVQELLSKMATVAQENFSGISVIKSYSLEHNAQEQFKNQAEESYQKNMALVKVQAWFFPLMILLIGISNLIVIFVGGNQYMQGKIAFGVLAEFIIYVNMLTWPVTVVGWVTSIVQQAEASQDRINTFLKQSPNVVSGSLEKRNIEGDLTFNNVTFQYPENGIKALDKVSFSLKSGETLGILGKIGSGKSTLLELIPRLYDPNEGSIKLDGFNLKKFTHNSLRNSIAYVPQNPFLFSESIEKNIRFGNQNASFEQIQEAAKNADVAKNIEGFKKGYQTILGERGVTLSGGQIQRVSIARAFVKKARILLLDDCLSAVDTETEETILKNLENIAVDKTTLIVSNRISSIKNADKIIVLENGKIIEQGNHVDLVNKQGYYRNLYEKQQTEKSI
tara:strand:+ start:5626 stop:7380 length:1755 start_codon:yes stop_codon:yes gene_type:complete